MKVESLLKEIRRLYVLGIVTSAQLGAITLLIKSYSNGVVASDRCLITMSKLDLNKVGLEVIPCR